MFLPYDPEVGAFIEVCSLKQADDNAENTDGAVRIQACAFSDISPLFTIYPDGTIVAEKTDACVSLDKKGYPKVITREQYEANK